MANELKRLRDEIRIKVQKVDSVAKNIIKTESENKNKKEVYPK